MPRFFSNKRLILLLVGVIVLVALISFSLVIGKTPPYRNKL